MSEPKKPTPEVEEAENASSSKPLSESEMEQVAGGVTQEQYDKWEAMGPADRTDHGPGSGE